MNYLYLYKSKGDTLQFVEIKEKSLNFQCPLTSSITFQNKHFFDQSLVHRQVNREILLFMFSVIKIP